MLKAMKAISLGGMRRLQAWVALNHGYRYEGMNTTLSRLLFRNIKLHVYDNYLNNCQYDHLDDWDPDLSKQQMDRRINQPKKIFPLPEIAVDLFASHMVSREARLSFVNDDTDIQENIDYMQKHIKLWSLLETFIPSWLTNGSGFIRFYTTSKGNLKLDWANSKYVYPVFDDDGELEEVTIRFVYETDEWNEKKDEMIWRWSKYKMTKMYDVEYDNPVFDKTKSYIPQFKIMGKYRHNLGFVQGEWIKTSFDSTSDDGKSILGGKSVMPYLDDFNYMASKQSSSVYYHLFPLLAMFGIYPNDIKSFLKNVSHIGEDKLRGINILSTEKPPGNADMRFLEAGHQGMAFADQIQDKNLQLLQHALKIVLLDPERIAAHAQSGAAMKALFTPVVNFIHKKREFLEEGLCNLMTKIETVSQKLKTTVQLPEGTIENSKKKWGNIFSDTVTDIQQRATYTSQLKLDKIISSKTATTHVAPDFGIKNVEEELSQIKKESEEEQENEMLRFQQEQDSINQSKPQPAAGKPDGKKKTKE